MNQPSIIYRNHIVDYTSNLFQSEFHRANGSLTRDFAYVLQGHCFYHKQMMCAGDDYSLVQKIVDELFDYECHNSDHSGSGGVIHWSKHFKYENPQFSVTFNLICQLVASYFDVEIFATRLNLYTPGDWKPYHHDSHAYSNGQKEDFTIGVSLGGTRALSFLHPSSGASFDFPQANGDVFAFDSTINKHFQHGVPRHNKSTGLRVENGPRLSIIVWGRRRRLYLHNAGQQSSAAADDADISHESTNADQNEQQDSGHHNMHESVPRHETYELQSATSSLPTSLDDPQNKSSGLPLREMIDMITTWISRQRVSGTTAILTAPQLPLYVQYTQRLERVGLCDDEDFGTESSTEGAQQHQSPPAHLVGANGVLAIVGGNPFSPKFDSSRRKQVAVKPRLYVRPQILE